MLFDMIFLIIDVFILIFGMLFIVFGGIAAIVFVYCKLTHKVFKEVFPKALDNGVRIVFNAFKTDSVSIETAFKMDKSWVSPITKALHDNKISCIERNAYICSSVACYEFMLADKEKEFDTDYFEKLIQSVFYSEVLPLYQTEIIEKEYIDVYIKKQDQVLFIYIGHCDEAYKKINQYRKMEQSYKLEMLNNADREMVE